VTVGITDGTVTEIIQGNLSVGQAVLVGIESAPAGTPSSGGPRLRL
jgi:hypothetical protein